MPFIKPSHPFQIVSLIALCGLSFATHAQGGRPSYFSEVGISVQSFHYKETDPLGEVLDREDGLLPGVEGSIGVHQDHSTLLLTGRLHSGTITYDGQTQDGTPLTTDTEERIVDVAAIIKHGAGESGDAARITMGAGYREWQRDILATEIVSGLFETYRWPYLMLGIEADVFQSGPWKAGFDWRLTRPVHPTIEIEAPGYDPLTLELGANIDANIGFPIEYRFTSRQAIVVVPYWQRWTLGHSRYKRLYSNGIPTPKSAREPDSETTLFGISATLHFSL